jgi:hypothetical protein
MDAASSPWPKKPMPKSPEYGSSSRMAGLGRAGAHRFVKCLSVQGMPYPGSQNSLELPRDESLLRGRSLPRHDHYLRPTPATATAYLRTPHHNPRLLPPAPYCSLEVEAHRGRAVGVYGRQVLGRGANGGWQQIQIVRVHHPLPHHRYCVERCAVVPRHPPRVAPLRVVACVAPRPRAAVVRPVGHTRHVGQHRSKGQVGERVSGGESSAWGRLAGRLAAGIELSEVAPPDVGLLLSGGLFAVRLRRAIRGSRGLWGSLGRTPQLAVTSVTSSRR